MTTVVPFILTLSVILLSVSPHIPEYMVGSVISSPAPATGQPLGVSKEWVGHSLVLSQHHPWSCGRSRGWLCPLAKLHGGGSA